MSREKSLPHPWTSGGSLSLKDGTLWEGDESSGSPRDSQSFKKKPSPKNPAEVSGLEGKPTPFGFGFGVFNPEV